MGSTQDYEYRLRFHVLEEKGGIQLQDMDFSLGLGVSRCGSRGFRLQGVGLGIGVQTIGFKPHSLG